MLTRERLRDRRLVVEDRKDRLQEHLLAVELAAQDGRERPHPVRLEVTTRPRFCFSHPAGLRPRCAKLGHRRTALLGEPAVECGAERSRQLGVAHRRVAEIEYVQPKLAIVLDNASCHAQVRGPSDQRLEGIEDLRQPPRRLDRRQRAVGECERAVCGGDCVVREDRHESIISAREP